MFSRSVGIEASTGRARLEKQVFRFYPGQNWICAANCIHLTVVSRTGGEQVSIWAAALFCQVNGHPDVLQPPLHL